MAFTENTQHGCVYMTSDKISARHMFTTRIGGVSKGVFASWNLGVNRGDDDAAVCQDIAVAPGNVRQQLRQTGIIAAPLTGVAVGSHVCLGDAENLQNGGYIRRCCSANVHGVTIGCRLCWQRSRPG